jgi:tripartite-type tricarboxylate transporter receptor subunit TctC
MARTKFPAPLRRRHLLPLLALPLLHVRTARAQAPFPSRPVSLVVAFPPGASTDVIARRLVERASAVLGGTIVVENRTGAAGNLAAAHVARSAPDGHTVLHHNYVSLLIAKAAGTQLDFDPVDAFVPVAHAGVNVNFLVVRPDLPARTLPELVALAKQQPDRLNMGTIGVGSAYHLGLEWLNLAFGMRIAHIPYRGAANAVTDLLGGRVDMMFSSLALAKPHLAAGRMRAIALTTPHRTPMFPDLMPIAEQGVPGFDLFTATAMFAPRGTPGPVVERLNAAINAALTDPQVRPRLEADGVIITPMPPAAFQGQVTRELAAVSDILTRTGIRLA